MINNKKFPVLFSVGIEGFVSATRISRSGADVIDQTIWVFVGYVRFANIIEENRYVRFVRNGR